MRGKVQMSDKCLVGLVVVMKPTDKGGSEYPLLLSASLADDTEATFSQSSITAAPHALQRLL